MIEIYEGLLIKLAGAPYFVRGCRYFDEGRVREVRSNDKSTSAVVKGTRKHDVQLNHTNRLLEGACDCPVSDGIDFCAHCVAVALELQARQAGRKRHDTRSALRQIRSYLSAKSHEQLLEELVGLAKEDRTLRDELLRRAKLETRGLSYEDFRAIIADIPRPDDVWEAREIRPYRRTVQAVLGRLGDVADRIDPLTLLRITEYAIREIAAVLAAGGASYDCLDDVTETMLDVHIGAVNRLDWPPAELASYLIDCVLDAGWHPFRESPDLYIAESPRILRSDLLAEIELRLSKPGTSKDGQQSLSYLRDWLRVEYDA